MQLLKKITQAAILAGKALDNFLLSLDESACVCYIRYQVKQLQYIYETVVPDFDLKSCCCFFKVTQLTTWFVLLVLFCLFAYRKLYK